MDRCIEHSILYIEQSCHVLSLQISEHTFGLFTVQYNTMQQVLFPNDHRELHDT